MTNPLRFAPEEPEHIINELKKLEPLYMNLLQGAVPTADILRPFHKNNTALIKSTLDACTAYRKAIEALHKVESDTAQYIRG